MPTSRRRIPFVISFVIILSFLALAIAASTNYGRARSPYFVAGLAQFDTIEILPYETSGYRYQIITQDATPPAGFELTSFDDSSWGQGQAAFGSGGVCSLQASVKTLWPLSTQLLVRKVVSIPAEATDVRVMVAVDNDVTAIFFNGVQISAGIQHGGCPSPDDLQISVPQSLVQAGQNIVVYQLIDLGVESYFDTRITASTSSSPGSCVTVTDLLGWWKGENNADDSARTNTGIPLNGTTFTAGVVGQAFNFDGIDDHVRMPYNPTFDSPNALTLEAWIFPTRFGQFNTVLAKWDSVDGVDQRSYALDLGQDGALSFKINTDGTHENFTTITSSNSAPLNAWSHVAGVYDGSSMKVYVNGALQGEVPYTQGIFAGTADVSIGAIATGGPLGQSLSNFTGQIDEASIYNRALSASEILAIFNAASAGKCPPLPSPTPTPPPPVGDLALSMTVEVIGSNSKSNNLDVLYRITVANNGPATASNIRVNDVLPPETTFISCFTSAGECSGVGNDQSIVIPTLAPPFNETIALLASINTLRANVVGITNTATVSSSTFDPNLTNNVATTTTERSPSISTISPATASPGETVDVTVNGHFFANGATLSLSGGGITINSYGTRNARFISANISVDTNAQEGSRDVVVTNPNGQQTVLSSSFAVLRPLDVEQAPIQTSPQHLELLEIKAASMTLQRDIPKTALTQLSGELAAAYIGGLSTGTRSGDFLLKVGSSLISALSSQDPLAEASIKAVTDQTAGYIFKKATNEYLAELSGPTLGVVTDRVVQQALGVDQVISGRITGTNAGSPFIGAGAPPTTVNILIYYSSLTHYVVASVRADCGSETKTYIFRYVATPNMIHSPPSLTVIPAASN
jgi:uncharacterized repeat protein (TIGR01451 family)